MKVALLFPILIFTVWILPSAGEESPAKEEILEEILQKAEESEKASQNKGFYLESTVRKLTEEGAVKGEETRSYRIIWIHDQPYAELIRINGKDLDPKSKADEEKRRREFAKKLEESRKQEEEVFTWKELYEKYEFTVLPSEADARYVLSFKPKKEGLRERNRMEKVMNHLKGKILVDEAYNLMKVEASLTGAVRFGLGILAKLDQLDIEYTQQTFQQLRVPATLRYKFAGRMGLFRTERQENLARFYDFYARDVAPPASAPQP